MNYIEKLKLVDVTKLNTKISNLVQRSIKHFNYDLATKEGIDSIKLLYEIICDKFPEAISKINLEKPIEEKTKRKYTKKSDKPPVEEKIKRKYIKKEKCVTSNLDVVKTEKRGRPKKVKTIEANKSQPEINLETPIEQKIKRHYTKNSDATVPIEKRIKRAYTKKDKTITLNSDIMKTEKRGRPRKEKIIEINNPQPEVNNIEVINLQPEVSHEN